MSGGSATYRVEHQTQYRHAGTVSVSHHLGCLTPRELPTQTASHFELQVDPQPADRVDRLDYFGNLQSYFVILAPYRELTVATRSIVHVRTRESQTEPERSPAWDAPASYGALAIDSEQFRYSSPYVETSDQLASYARPSFAGGRPVLDGAIDLMHRIHADFRFDPGSTLVTTPLSRVMSEQRGVC